MNRFATLALVLLSGGAQAATSYSIIVNGQVAPAQAIVVGGQTYVPLSALKMLGVTSSLKGTTLTLGASAAPSTAPGGANQKASLEGCMNEALFNGVWRLTVNSFKPGVEYGTHPGYILNLEWKNGTARSIDALTTGIKEFTLVLADGTTLTSDDLQQLKYRKLPQAAGMTFNIPFYADDALPSLAQPSKLLVEIDPSIAAATSSGVSYTTLTPSFRVRLDCRK
ncbi:hypothetical protein DKM44_04075 [Deinococcus irradiatisoli]|uniref:Copper amine oxidase-like N-terminal domain-containing protein n=1 Tax=Deinococcus irradiatisoli TaxID=2202254 RepID=A0A2Z3JMT1_9DEIO|nr:hypothetical protein [Deinococcus irradiatisoli]AWN22514.1 hypothetical protein DKM44_04075 [Deinococcus irradiatisoli]